LWQVELIKNKYTFLEIFDFKDKILHQRYYFNTLQALINIIEETNIDIYRDVFLIDLLALLLISLSKTSNPLVEKEIFNKTTEKEFGKIKNDLKCLEKMSIDELREWDDKKDNKYLFNLCKLIFKSSIRKSVWKELYNQAKIKASKKSWLQSAGCGFM
jgi:hypothetical protein